MSPLVAMQFTDEVRWDLADFAAGAALLIGVGAAIELAVSVFGKPLTRIVAIALALMTAMLIWADAAVGIF